MSDEGLVRRFQGQPAIFVSFKGNEEVEFRVGDHVRTLATADWQCLPPYGDRARPAKHGSNLHYGAPTSHRVGS